MIHYLIVRSQNFHGDFGKTKKIRSLTNQYKYMDKKKSAPLDGSCTNFWFGGMSLAWFSHLHPNLQYKVSHIAQIVEKMFLQDTKKEIKRINSMPQCVLDNPAEIINPKLGLQTLRMLRF